MMSPEDRPVRLSERLKQLDDAQHRRALPPFDLDAVVIGGRRRRRRRAVVGTVAAAAATVVIAANLSLPGRFQETVRPDDDPAPVAVVDSRQPDVSYRQREGTVTAYRDGTAVAALTLSSVTYNRTGGQLHLKVTAERDFRFSAADFIWEGGEQGTDRGPIDATRVVQVSRLSPQDLVIDFRRGGKGTVVWAPGPGRIAGGWLISASATPVRAADPDRASYLQRDDVVSVYQGAELVATLTLVRPGADSNPARLLLKVSAVRSFSFPASQFIWEDRDGGDQSPLNGDRVLRVDANTTRNLEIAFRAPGAGAVLWVTDESNDMIAGTWIPDN
jgi:hypothetical protein